MLVNHAIWCLKSCSLLRMLGEMISPFATAGSGKEDRSLFEIVQFGANFSTLLPLIVIWSLRFSF